MPCEFGEEVKFSATKKKTRYTSPDGKYSICRFSCSGPLNADKLPPSTYLTCSDQTRSFTVKGSVQDGPAEVEYILSGTWELENNPKIHCKEAVFIAKKAVVKMPDTKRETLHYLEMAAKGVGKSTASKIYAVFKDDSIRMCAKQIDKVKARVRLSDEAAQGLKHSCRTLIIQQEMQEYLGDLQLPQYALNAITDKFGEETLATMKEKPYKLISVVSFKICDMVASIAKIPRSSRKRAVAALMEAQRNVVKNKGSLCADKAMVLAAAKKLLGPEMKEETIQSAYDLLSQYYFLIKQGNYVYSKENFIAERDLAKRIVSFVSRPQSGQLKIDNAFFKWKKLSNITLSEKQEEAVKALSYPLSVITGGPGTGKSTTLKAILDVWKMAYPNKGSIVCMAPTGRAAKRMTECTGIEASTIHSACSLVPSDAPGGFTPMSDEKLAADLIAIDEVSMVDVNLFKFIMDSIDLGTKVILLGDVDQLPSVGPGNVLSDLIRSGAVKTTVLDRNYRQGEKSSIADVAYAINSGNTKIHFDEQCRFIPVNTEETDDEMGKVIETIVNEYKEGVAKYGKQQCAVLSPTHYYRSSESSLLCTDKLNEMIQKATNSEASKSDSKYITSGTTRFYVGDRVVQTKNTKEALNGDLGEVVEISGNKCVIRFDDKQEGVEYTSSELANVELGYCLTVHKVQGSEFACCIMPASMTQKAMLIRRLYYTAVTRAKKEFVFVGSKYALDVAVNTLDKTRASLLPARIVKGLMSE